MKVQIKIPGGIYRQMMEDLTRPHPFAGERVGFAFGRIGSLINQDKIVLITRYQSVPDHQYVDDTSVGARIGSEALTFAMQAVYHVRAKKEGIFHIHLHDRYGSPSLSKTDMDELPKLIPGFQAVGRNAPHGIIILSRDHGSGWVWLPNFRIPARASSISVIGVPIGVFEWRQ
jgi:hypothetical protein